jgi:hypothetical protein
MRKLEGTVKEIVSEMEYLRQREKRFASTNGELSYSWVARSHLTHNEIHVESTNRRVKKFGFFTFVALIALGVWQVFHLRSYFKRKYIID